MTYQQAKTKAARLAKKNAEFISVVCEDLDLGEYDIATEYDLETYYVGATPLVTFGPDGYLA